VSLYWALGGTALLDTVGGEIEELARERSTAAVLFISLTVVLKVLAGLLALALMRAPRRSLTILAAVAGVGLALYGGTLVVAGALVLAGVVDPSGDVDEYALRWHVFFWDAWFVVWGVALAVAAQATRSRRSATDSTIRDAR
jgi:phosphate/sulfate permease